MANELALLDRVLARFSMATTDEAFTASIATLLVPTLDVLRSEHAESRNKVITVLSHVNKRVKANAAIKLPLMALLSQYKNTASNAFLRNFNIIYIEMAFERTTQDERLEALPLILCDISKWSITHQARFFHLVLGQIEKIDVNSTKHAEILSFAKNDDDRRCFLRWSTDLLLATRIVNFEDIPSAGLSKTRYNALLLIGSVAPTRTANSAAAIEKPSFRLTAAQTNELKAQLTSFLCLSRCFNANELLVPLIAAASNAQHAVASAGDDALKRQLALDLASDVVIDALFRLIEGDVDKSIADDDRVTPADPAVRNRALTYLMRFEKAANRLTQALRVVDLCVYAPQAPVKLRRQGMSFANWVLQYAAVDALRTVAPQLLTRLLDLCVRGDAAIAAATSAPALVDAGAGGGVTTTVRQADGTALTMAGASMNLNAAQLFANAVNAGVVLPPALVSAQPAAASNATDAAIVLSAQDAQALRAFGCRALATLLRRVPKLLDANDVAVCRALLDCVKNEQKSSVVRTDSDAAFRVACLSYVNEEDDADVNARGVTRLTPKAVDDMFALLESENNS